MRLAALLCLALMGCNALAERGPNDHEQTPADAGGAGSASGSAGSGGGSAGTLAIDAPTWEVGGAVAVEPEPAWSDTAAQNGATFCEAQRQSLEYCEPAPEDGQGCIAYGDDDVPGWAYWLVLECSAHCGVGMSASERVLEGSCCYTVVSEIYGR